MFKGFASPPLSWTLRRRFAPNSSVVTFWWNNRKIPDAEYDTFNLGLECEKNGCMRAERASLDLFVTGHNIFRWLALPGRRQ